MTAPDVGGAAGAPQPASSAPAPSANELRRSVRRFIARSRLRGCFDAAEGEHRRQQPLTVDRDPVQGSGEFLQLVRGERDVVRAEVLQEVRGPGDAGDGDDPRFLRPQPGQRELGRRGALADPQSCSSSTSGMLAARFSGVLRGPQATNPILSSWHSGRIGLSAPRHNMEYSFWITVSGWTAWARRT